MALNQLYFAKILCRLLRCDDKYIYEKQELWLPTQITSYANPQLTF